MNNVSQNNVGQLFDHPIPRYLGSFVCKPMLAERARVERKRTTDRSSCPQQHIVSSRPFLHLYHSSPLTAKYGAWPLTTKGLSLLAR